MSKKNSGKQAQYNLSTDEHRSPAEVIKASRQLLSNAQRGLEDIESDEPSRRTPGLHNVAVFGRSVTIALQRLRNIVDGFDAWYQSEVSAHDPLLNYFNSLRNGLLKEASPPQPSTSTFIGHLNTGNLANVFRDPPPAGASGMFIGEGGTGGSGWIVKLPDGTEEKYYARLSASFDGSVTTHLTDAPQQFLGKTYQDTTVSGIARRYVEWLEHMVDEAEHRFAAK